MEKGYILVLCLHRRLFAKDMALTTQIATLFRNAYNGGNWTAVDLKGSLSDVTCQQATAKIGSLNTIADLVYHIGYYVTAQSAVLEGGTLNANDKYSFDHPPVQSQEDWLKPVDKTWQDAEKLAGLIAPCRSAPAKLRVSKSQLWNILRNPFYCGKLFTPAYPEY